MGSVRSASLPLFPLLLFSPSSPSPLSVSSRALLRDPTLSPTSLQAFQSFLANHDSLLYNPPSSRSSSSTSTSLLPSPSPTSPLPPPVLLSSHPQTAPTSVSDTPPSPPSRALSTLSIDLSASPQPASPSPPTALHDLFALANLRIVNNFTSLEDLYGHLVDLDLENTERVRPSWDNYFMVSFRRVNVVSLSFVPSLPLLPFFLASKLASLATLRSLAQILLLFPTPLPSPPQTSDPRLPSLPPLKLHETSRRSHPRSREEDRLHRVQWNTERNEELQRGWVWEM